VVVSLIILVETVASNRLTAATGTRLKVASNLVQPAASHSAIVALRMFQVLRAIAVRDRAETNTGFEGVNITF
jgi:hypothetical protein